MEENKIDYVWTTQNGTDYSTGLATLVGIFTFFISLSKKLRKSIRKMGGKHEGYVNRIFTAATAHTDDLPFHNNLAEFTKDRNLYYILTGIRSELQSKLIEPLDDTIMQLGHEMMEHADHDYTLLTQADLSGNDSLKEALDGIAELTAGMGKRPIVAIQDIAGSGSVTLNTIVPNSKVLNIGDSILEVSGSDLTNKLKVNALRLNPGSSFTIPIDIVKLVIRNVSTDIAGRFTAKVRSV